MPTEKKWKNYPLKGVLVLSVIYFISTIIINKLSENKSWQEAFTQKNLILKAIGAILVGLLWSLFL